MARRKSFLLSVALLLLAIVALVWPSRKVREVHESRLEVTVVVTHAATGAPIPDAHVALYKEFGEVVGILRTDAAGTASTTTDCLVSTAIDENPLTGLTWRSDQVAGVPTWLVVTTAHGYRPPDPWWLWDRHYAAAVQEGEAYRLSIPIKLEPQSGNP